MTAPVGGEPVWPLLKKLPCVDRIPLPPHERRVRVVFKVVAVVALDHETKQFAVCRGLQVEPRSEATSAE